MYKDDTVWKAVQDYLPSQNRLHENNMPEEAFIVLSDKNRIHLDVYSREDSKATIVLLHGVGGKIQIEPEDFRIPLILLHPQDDRWTDLSLSRMFYDKLLCEKELHLLNGAGHFPIEEEGLNALIQNSVAFIEKHR